MDLFNYLSDRQMNPEHVFSNNVEMTVDEEDFSVTLRSLENLLEKQIKVWWDVFTFKHYQKENLIFRSLRWDVPPQDGLNDPVFMEEWLAFFNKAGRELQDLVLKRKQIKLGRINENIRQLQEKLEPIKESNQMKDFNINIKKKLDKVDREMQKKKVKKFTRDSNDFRTNKIYTWQNINDGSQVETVGDLNHEVEHVAKKSTSKITQKKYGQKNVVKKNEQGSTNPSQNGESSGKNSNSEYAYSPRPPRQGRGDYDYHTPRPYRGNTPQGRGNYDYPSPYRSDGPRGYPPQQEYQQWRPYPPVNQHPDGNGIQLYNRYTSLEEGGYYDQQPYNQPFLGSRGRGGRRGTPRGYPRVQQQRGRLGPPNVQNVDTKPLPREGGDAGGGDPSNPKK